MSRVSDRSDQLDERRRTYDLVEVGSETVTQKSELEKIGYLGIVAASYQANPICAHFELHIEQGPILEKSEGKIGPVGGVQAYKWLKITVKDADSRTGTTHFQNRSDAMLTAAKLILHVHNKATELGCLASTGILTLNPGSTNIVPGWVQFLLDIRCPEDAVLQKLEQALKFEFAKIAAGEDIGGLNTLVMKGRGCTGGWQLDADSPATRFHEVCIKCVEASAADMLGTFSGYTSQRAPTFMIFVSCRNGVSHSDTSSVHISETGPRFFDL
ncbi:N-carbamoyl-L-amino acid hydrolase [Diplocarpon rosae]|nr:N-carbamoyl-L-amino acid hydrolase [Diplocarpon rosae]